MPSKLQEVGPLWVTVPTVVRTPGAKTSAARKLGGGVFKPAVKPVPGRAIARIIRSVLDRSTGPRGFAHETHIEKPHEQFRE
jgi:hypothetical protein